MKRKEFLIEFLGALGAEAIQWQEEKESYVSGRVIYELNDPNETQDFCWHLQAKNVPSSELKNLAKLIRDKKLLSIDQIKVTKEELYLLYNEAYNLKVSAHDFSSALEQLEEVEVAMVDDRKETDAYFIHE